MNYVERAINAEILGFRAGYEAKATRYLARDGQQVEYTVYCPTDMGWQPPDRLRNRWWELCTEAGDPSGRFVYFFTPVQYDSTTDYWMGLKDQKRAE